MPAMLDVAVIGGGPAGLLASARLAAAGLQTTVLEEHKSIGEPVHCTGVLAAEAFDEFDLSRRSLLNELTTARFWSPAGQQVSYSGGDRKSTRLNSSHLVISYAVFCLKKNQFTS